MGNLSSLNSKEAKMRPNLINELNQQDLDLGGFRLRISVFQNEKREEGCAQNIAGIEEDGDVSK
jgi:hypothetical protein